MKKIILVGLLFGSICFNTLQLNAADVFSGRNATVSGTYYKYVMTYSKVKMDVSSNGSYQGAKARNQACVQVLATSGDWCNTRTGSKAFYDGTPGINLRGSHTFRVA